jgi:hypothetical protein
MRRWSIRILIGLAAVIVLIIVAVQVVLWSQLPKDIVTKQIEQELGLRISCRRLTTSWLGRTTLTDVSLGLPLAEKSFLNVATLKVKHSSIFGIILTRAVSIDYIEIDKPDVIVLQDATGQWNLAEVAELLGRVGGGNAGAASASSGVPKLPNVRLIDGTVRVIDNAHHTATLSPVNVNGYAVGSLVWEYDLGVGDAISVVGKLAPGSSWQHQLKLTAHHLDSLTRGWGINSYGADVAATWDGQLSSDGGVSGTLTLDHASATGVPGAGDVRATGSIAVEAGGSAAPATGTSATGESATGTSAPATVALAPGAAPAPAASGPAPGAALITIRPLKLDIATSLATLPKLELTGGSLVDDNAGVHVRAVQLSALGGFALINASFNPATCAADLDTRWTGLSLSESISHSGSLLASLRMPFHDHPEIKIQLDSHGIASANKWDAQLQIAGAGQSWSNIDWVLSAPQLQYTGSQTVQFTDLVGHVSQKLPTIELTSLTLPARPHLKSFGKVNLATREWSFRLDAGGAPRAEGFVVPVDLNLDASGNQDLYTLHSANVLVADTTLHATGFYDRQQPNPVSLNVSVSQPPELPPNAAISGHLGGQLTVTGKLFKNAYNLTNPDLKVDGMLSSSDLVVLNRPIGNFAGHLVGTVGADWDTHLYTTSMSMFGGQWKLAVHRPTSDGGVEATLEVNDLPVQQLARLGGLQNIGGTIQEGSWTLVVPASPRIDTITLRSSPTVIVALQGFGVAADRVEIKPQLSDGMFTVDVGARCGDGRMSSTISCDLLSPRHLGMDLQVDNWPYRSSATGSDVRFVASVKPSHFDLDLGQKSLAGTLVASMDVLLEGQSLGHADLAASVQGRAVNISRFSGKVLGGTFDGNLALDVDNPLMASGQMRWFDVDAAAFVPLAPAALDGLGGIYSGTVTIAPARDPRPFEPVRFDVNVSAANAHFRSVQIGTHRLVAVHAVGYANLDRVILENSDIDVAGGMAHLQARVSQAFSTEDVRLSFENLQLDQLAHVMPQFNGKPMPGLLNGSIHVMGSGADTAKLEGSCDMTLAAADLGNFGPISALYNALHPGGGGAQSPQGTGEVSMEYEQNALRVTNFHYFNRGIDAHGIFSVGPSILTLPNTPLDGQVAGTAEPLSNTRLPFLGDFNDVFGALQRNLTTIDVGGTVNAPTYTQATLNQIGTSLKELLVGSARADNGG